MSTDSQVRSLEEHALRPPPESAGPVAAPRWGALVVILAGVFATSLDFFVVNVAIPSTQHDLHANAAQVQFFMAGFGLAAAAGVITGGRLGDIYGRRRMFALGLTLFTLASVACGVAQNPGELIAGRVVQGLGTALLTPQALTIVSTAYAGEQRAKAFTLYGLTIGFAGVFGQLIGGGLIAANIAGLGWRVIFLVNIPIGAAALAYTRRLVPESKGDGSTKLDLVGAVMITAGLIAVVLPLIEGRQQGWPTWVYASFAAAVVLIGGFVLYQHRLAGRGGTPLISLELFRERAFSVGLLTALAWTSAMASFFLVLALYLQNGRTLSALDSGLVFLPLGVGFFVASTLTPKLGAMMGRQLLAAGSLVVVAGYVVLAETASHIGTSGAVAWLVPGLLISGWGMGMVLAPLPATILAGVTPQHAAAASGVLTTIQEVGNALGVALVGVVFFAALGRHGGGAGAYPHAFAEGLYLLVGFAVLVALLVQALPKAPRQS